MSIRLLCGGVLLLGIDSKGVLLLRRFSRFDCRKKLLRRRRRAKRKTTRVCV